MMFDGHEDLFFFKRQISLVHERIPKGKSNKGQNLDENINERRNV